ncbi:energy-coupling factor transporter transmembrane protein EcfT [Paenibacillus sp. P25]|nr:energy-coupling factor transporter transmembrane protein EcfT [Paenibacillus sp. P25]
MFGSLFPKTALLIVMSMRFVPSLKHRLAEIASVQRMKGVDPGHGDLRKRTTDGMKSLQILLTLSLEEALQTADAMKAKGYGSGSRGRYEEFVMRSRDWGALGGSPYAVCRRCDFSFSRLRDLPDIPFAGTGNDAGLGAAGIRMLYAFCRVARAD